MKSPVPKKKRITESVDRVSWTSAEDEQPKKKLKEKVQKRALSDQTKIKGIPWSQLRSMLQDPETDIDAFYAGLDKTEKKLLAKLDAAQSKQGDAKPLR